MQRRHHDGAAALPSSGDHPGHLDAVPFELDQLLLALRGIDEAHGHSHHQGGPHALLPDQSDEFEQGGGRIADRDDPALQQSLLPRLAHPDRGPRGVLGLGLGDDVFVAHIAMDRAAVVVQAPGVEPDPDHLDVDVERRPVDEGLRATVDRILGESREVLVLEIGRRVDDATDHLPVGLPEVVGPRLPVDDVEAAVFDAASGAGHLAHVSRGLRHRWSPARGG